MPIAVATTVFHFNDLDKHNLPTSEVVEPYRLEAMLFSSNDLVTLCANHDGDQSTLDMLNFDLTPRRARELGRGLIKLAAEVEALPMDEPTEAWARLRSANQTDSRVARSDPGEQPPPRRAPADTAATTPREPFIRVRSIGTEIIHRDGVGERDESRMETVDPYIIEAGGNGDLVKIWAGPGSDEDAHEALDFTLTPWRARLLAHELLRGADKADQFVADVPPGGDASIVL